MSTFPTLSFIIPAYNSEKTIKRTLSSIAEQTFRDYEVIVINDGSTDGTLSVIETFKDKIDNLLVKTIKNGGVSNARNKGLEIASGEYVSFVDSDDTISPLYAEEMIKAIKDEDIAMCNYSIYDGEKETFPKDLARFGTRTYKNTFLKKFIRATDRVLTSSCRTLYKRSLIKDNSIEFSTDVKWGEDMQFVLKCLEHVDTIRFTQDSLYRVFENPSSATRSYMKGLDDNFRALNPWLIEYTKRLGDKNLERNALTYTGHSILYCSWNSRQKGNPFTEKERIKYITGLLHEDLFKKGVSCYLKHPEKSWWSFSIWPRLFYYKVLSLFI